MAIVQLPPFARLLRRHRVEAELTQEELAERAGLSARTISDLERGVKTRPHRVTVELLADALHLAGEDHTALLAAVPRTAGSHANAAKHTVDWLPDGFEPRSMEAHPAPCSRELCQALEGLVGLYVRENGRAGQINVTVIMFSVSEPVTPT
ncbi:MAG: hypothetical protein NVS2B16_24220 [Chloroflexota bacterium]